MAILNKVLDTVETIIFKCPFNLTTTILSIIFCNNSDSAINITLYAYPKTSSANDGTTILKNYSIPAEDTFIWSANERFILNSGDIISGVAGVSGVITSTINFMGQSI